MSDITAPDNPAGQKSILPILSINFVGTLGFSIVIPFMVFLVNKWGGNAIIYGLLAATYSAFQLVGAPILGRWSDRYGRRRILLLSQAGTLLSWVVFLIAFALPTDTLAQVDSSLLGQFAITAPLVILFFARAADGLTGGNVSVANAYLADITDDKHRSENFGRMAISTNIGFVAGPAIAGLIGATIYGEILPVAAALFVSFIATLLIAFGLTESKPKPIHINPEEPNACKVFGHEHKECFELESAKDKSTGSIFKLPGIPPLLAVNFMVMLGFSFFYVAFPTHAATGLGWTIRETGIYFAVFSVVMIIVQGPVLARLSKRVEDGVLVTIGAAIMAIGFLAMVWDSTAAVYTAAVLIAFGNGLMWPTFMAILAERAGSEFQGAVQGFASSSGAAASIVGLIAGGLIYIWIGAYVFIMSAVIIAMVTVIASVTCLGRSTGSGR